jgi:hypothetical protein
VLILYVEHKVIKLEIRMYWAYIQTWNFDLELCKSILRLGQGRYLSGLLAIEI